MRETAIDVLRKGPTLFILFIYLFGVCVRSTYTFPPLTRIQISTGRKVVGFETLAVSDGDGDGVRKSPLSSYLSIYLLDRSFISWGRGSATANNTPLVTLQGK